MRIWYPYRGIGVDFVGYNHAIAQLCTVLNEWLVDSPEKADAALYCNIPYHPKPEFLKPSGLPLIVYTMYEATRLPKAWAKWLNRNADVILVPSKFCVKVFQDSGVYRPIFILPLAVDTDKITPVPKSELPENYVFYWQGVSFDPYGRKGYDIALRAFKELKSEGRLRDDALLVVKSRKADMKNFTMDCEGPDGIRFIQKTLSREELLSLMRSVDCCINPTHGEGFGYIPLEQMAMSKPVILTGWSMPYLDERYNFPAAYDMKTACVRINNAHLWVSLNGFDVNFGGLAHEYPWLPRLGSYRPDGIYHHDIWGEDKVSLKNLLHNIGVSIHRASGLYEKPRKPAVIFQEDPGLDAHIDIEDLKNKMVWCYTHRLEAEMIGRNAAAYVKRCWSMHEMKREWSRLKPIVKGALAWSR